VNSKGVVGVELVMTPREHVRHGQHLRFSASVDGGATWLPRAVSAPLESSESARRRSPGLMQTKTEMSSPKHPTVIDATASALSGLDEGSTRDTRSMLTTAKLSGP